MEYYKIFYTDMQMPAGAAQPDLTQIIPLESWPEEEALNKAFSLISSGAIVWKIEGPDGFLLDRAEIERQYRIFKTT